MTKKEPWQRTIAIITVLLAGFALSGCSVRDEVDNGINDAVDPEPETTTEVYLLEVGDCEIVADKNAEEAAHTKIVDCSEPHDTEAYAAITMEDEDFPGDSAVREKAESACMSEFETFMGINFEDSIYSFRMYFPSERTWQEGDREILCRVVDPSGAQITGSLKGAAM